VLWQHAAGVCKRVQGRQHSYGALNIKGNTLAAMSVSDAFGHAVSHNHGVCTVKNASWDAFADRFQKLEHC